MNIIGAARCVKWSNFSAIALPKMPNKKPMAIVLRPCAKAAVTVTFNTSEEVQPSFLPMAITGSQWFGMAACKMLNKKLPARILYIVRGWIKVPSVLDK